MIWHISKISSLLSLLPRLLPFPSVSFMAVSPRGFRSVMGNSGPRIRTGSSRITPAKKQRLPPFSSKANQTLQFNLYDYGSFAPKQLAERNTENFSLRAILSTLIIRYYPQDDLLDWRINYNKYTSFKRKIDDLVHDLKDNTTQESISNTDTLNNGPIRVTVQLIKIYALVSWD
ncbi:LOW QUALITY PROTEIN: hypothetical protein NC652_026577 [Populus alba x Populus x berolinensis]|nr:LOW QUALITY PROTEIN: hypothetical protein NC652_026577 [Populus alba x Populus x berolinensis]